MKNSFCLIAAILMFSIYSYGEFKSIEEANTVLVNDDSEVLLKEDGSSKTIGTTTLKANNDQGRQELALYSIPFQPDRNPTKILWAKTITNGKETPVDLKTIKNIELPQPRGGISKARQLIIPFTHLEAGSQVVYKYEETSKPDVVPGLFNMAFSYGLRFPELAGTTKIISPKPLLAKINDPNKSLLVTEGKEGTKYTWTIKLTKPAYFLPKDEEGVTLEPNNFPLATVTTAQSWAEISTPLAEKYEKVLSKPLPQIYKEIAVKAKVGSNDLEKSGIIVAEMATKLTYAGDWTSAERGLVPREFTEVAKTRTGDCKDFAAGMTGILRSLGVKAAVAVVGRASPQSPDYLFIREPVGGDSPPPAMNLFNHAIVRIESKDGQILWIDPTNPTAQPKAPFSDISGSLALRLERKNSTLENVPSATEKDSTVSIEKKITPRLDGTADFSASMKATGLMAANLNAATLQVGQPAMEQALWTFFMAQPQKKLSSTSSFSAKTRSYRPYDASVNATINTPILEKDGNSLFVNPLPIGIMNFKLVTKDRTSAIYLGERGEIKVTNSIRGIDVNEEFTGDCQVYSDWIDLKRRVFKSPDGLRIEDTLITKVSFLRAKDLNDERLKTMLWKLQGCASTQGLKVTALDLKNPDQLDNRRSIESDASVEKAINILNNSKSNDNLEYKSLRILEAVIKKDEKNALAYAYLARIMRSEGYHSGEKFDATYLKRSIELADKSISLNPQLVRGYIERARSFMYLKDLTNAKKDFSVAFKLDPQLLGTYLLGGDLMKTEGKIDLAEKSYVKALSLAKQSWEKTTVLNKLAGLALDHDQNQKAIQYYQQIIALEPNDPWILNNVSIAYSNLKQWDDSISVLKKALSISEFGMAKSNLISAYSGKVLSLVDKTPRTERDLKEAEELAKAAIKLDGNSSTALATIATVYIELSKQDPQNYASDSSEYIKRTMISGIPPQWFFSRIPTGPIGATRTISSVPTPTTTKATNMTISPPKPLPNK